jgi:hypothetical protein
MTKLIRIIIAACIFLPGLALALDSLPTTWISISKGTKFSTPDACVLANVANPTTQPYGGVSCPSTSSVCYADDVVGGVRNHICSSNPKPTCPANSSLQSDGTCSCASGYVEQNGQCVPQPPPQSCQSGQASDFEVPVATAQVDASGKSYIDSTYKELATVQTHQCSGGCDYLVSGDNSTGDVNFYWESASPGTYVVLYTFAGFTSTGDSCNANTAQNPPPTPPSNPSSAPIGNNPVPSPSPDQSASSPTGSGNGGTPGSGTGSSSGTGGSGSTGGGTGTGDGTGTGSGTGAGDGTGTSSGSGSGSGSGTPSPDCTTTNSCTDSNPGPGLPGVPTLYTPQYPDGIQGVWDKQIGQLQSTPVFSLVHSMFPTGINSGTPPTWTLDLNLGQQLNFGTFELTPDSMIWPVLRTLVIVSALLLAYRLVFGG